MVEIKLYDYFDEYGYYNYIGVGALSANNVVDQITKAKGQELVIRINSVGGFVYDGWAIYNALLNHDKKVTTIIEGLAASIASVIAMAGDEVKAFKASLLMIHKPSNFNFGDANADQLRKDAEILDIIQDVIIDIYQTKTNLDASVIEEMVNAETWLKAEDAKNLNFIDTIIDSKSVEIVKNSFDRINQKAPAPIRAYVNSTFKIIDKNNMETDVKKIKQNLQNVLNKVSNALKNVFEPKNAEAELEGGGKVYYDGELAVGTAVYSDEEMTTPLTDGSHTLTSGTTITVADGSITEVTEASSEETPSNEVETLKAENAELKTLLNTANETLTKLANTVSNYTPDGRQQNFSKEKNEKKNSKEEFKNKLNARKNEYKK